MSEIKVIQYSDKYKVPTYSMFHAYRDWFLEEFMKYTGSDFLKITGMDLSQYENSILSYLKLKPPEGSLILVKTDEGIAGMGVIHKLSEDTGEIKRMYTVPKFRRRGFGRLVLNELLNVGRDLGCSRFLLDSPRFSVSHGLYGSAGFYEVEEYPESEIPPVVREHWIFMEKLE